MNIPISYKPAGIFSFALSVIFLLGSGSLFLNGRRFFADTRVAGFQGATGFTSLVSDGSESPHTGVSWTPLVGLCSVEANGDNLTDYTSDDASAVQMAVNAATSGDTLKVAGACTGVQATNNMTQTLYLSQSLTIQGGYNPADWFATPDPDAYPTELSADGNGRVVFLPANITATLSTLILTDGDETTGAGIYVSDRATLTVSHSLLSSHEAESGSAIFNDGIVIVDSTTFDSNNAASDGTINNQNTLTVLNTTFSDNTAFRGGGIYNDETRTIHVNNSTFGNNNVEEGGGIHNRGVMTVTFSTFYGNSASFGSAVQNWNGTMTLTNNIMAGNTGSTTQCLNEGTLASSVNNLITGGSCNAALTVDPLLSSLGDYGGNTETFGLLAYSPVIDFILAGTAGCGTTITTDQRGFVRPTDDGCDIGAVELEINFAPVAGADAYETLVNIPLVITDTGVLGNDVDGDGDPITAVLDTDVTVGTLVFNSDGSFTYTPSEDWTGITTFTYHAYDGQDNSSPILVTLTVNAAKGLTIYLPIITR
jgi:predicted outer membrane repeat protein